MSGNARQYSILAALNATVMRNEDDARWQRYASRPSSRRYGESEGVPPAQDVVQMSRGVENLHSHCH